MKFGKSSIEITFRKSSDDVPLKHAIYSGFSNHKVTNFDDGG